VLVVKVAVLVAVLYATAEATVLPLPFLSTNEMVPGCTGSLKVAVTVELKATPVTPAAGVVPVTAGGVSVVNDQETGLVITLPARSTAPLTVAV